MPKKFIGIVTSDAPDKTIVVTTVRRVTHPVYGKQYTVTKKFSAHDEGNTAHLGDRVEISETRPISRSKHFKLDRILETGHATVDLKDETEILSHQKTEPEESKG